MLFTFLLGGFLTFSSASFGANFYRTNSQNINQNFITSPTSSNNPFIPSTPPIMNPSPVNYAPNTPQSCTYGAYPVYATIPLKASTPNLNPYATNTNPYATNSNPYAINSNPYALNPNPYYISPNPYPVNVSPPNPNLYVNPFWASMAINQKPYSLDLKFLSEEQEIKPKYPSPEELIPEGTHIEVLLMGQTGSGKSTFLNTAANYIFDGSFGIKEEEQNVEVIIPTKYIKPTMNGYSHSENNVDNQGKSQTSEPKAYMLGDEERSFTFIDTPGMADTEGMEQDEKHLDRILKDASESNISGIILFFNGSDARNTATKKYSINKLMGSIPNKAFKKTIVVLTHCRKNSSGFPVQEIVKLGVSEDRIFYMDNSVLASNPESWSDKDNAQYLKRDWDDSMVTMTKIIKKLMEDTRKVGKYFGQIRDLRNMVIADLLDVKLKIREIQATQDAIDYTEAQLAEQKEKAEGLKDYSKKAIVKTTKFVRNSAIKEYSTICKVHDTECHHNCGVDETTEQGDTRLTGCLAFNGSSNGERCNVCSTDTACPYNNHFHAHGSFKEVEVTLQDKLQEYKKQYEDAENKVHGTEAEINDAQAAIELINYTVDQFTKKTEARLMELKQICTGYNFIAELYSTIEILEQEKHRCTSHQALRTAEQFIEALKLMAQRLQMNDLQKPVIKNTNDNAMRKESNYNYSPTIYPSNTSRPMIKEEMPQPTPLPVVQEQLTIENRPMKANSQNGNINNNNNNNNNNNQQANTKGNKGLFKNITIFSKKYKHS